MNLQRYRPFLPAALAFSAGIFLSWLLPVGKTYLLVGFVACAAAWLVLRKVRPAVSARVGLAAIVAGGAFHFAFCCRPGGNDVSNWARSSAEDREGSTVLVGRVLRAPLAVSGGARGKKRKRLEYEVSVRKVADGSYSGKARGKAVVVLWNDEVTAAPGDEVEVRGRLRRPPKARLPGGFDYRSYLADKGVFSILYVSSPDDLRVLGGASFLSFRRAVWRVRSVLVSRLMRVPGGEDGAFLAALLYGYRKQLPREVQEKFRISGTGHLLAVSGLHVAMLAAIAWWAAGIAGAGRRTRPAIVLVLVVAYIFLAGSRSSVVRAGIVAAVLLLARILDRQPNSANALSLAALVILLWRPGQLLEPGFQMSFVAVAGIALVFPRIHLAYLEWRAFPEELVEETQKTWDMKLWESIRHPLFLGAAAWISLAPLLMYHFGVVSPYSVPLNAFAVPFSGVVIALGLVCSLVSAVSLWVAVPFGIVSSAALSVLEAVVYAVGRLPGAHFYVPHPPAVLVGAYYVLLVLLLARSSIRLPKLVPASVAAAVFSANLMVAVEPPRGTQPAVTFLDVGGGISAVATSRFGSGLLADSGGVRDHKSLIRALNAQQVHELDALLLMTGAGTSSAGAADFVGQFPVRKVCLPQEEAPSEDMVRIERMRRERGLEVVHPRRGDVVSTGTREDAVVEVLEPCLDLTRTWIDEGSSVPLALSVRCGSMSVVFVDASRSRTLRVLLAAGVPKADVLWIASRPKASAEPLHRLLDETAPSLVVTRGPRRSGPDAAFSKLELACTERGIRLLAVNEIGSVKIEPSPSGLSVYAWSGSHWRKME